MIIQEFIIVPFYFFYIIIKGKLSFEGVWVNNG